MTDSALERTTDTVAQTIPQVRAQVDCGEITPVGLVRRALARISHVEDKIQAFAAVFADEALAVAQESAPQAGRSEDVV